MKNPARSKKLIPSRSAANAVALAMEQTIAARGLIADWGRAAKSAVGLLGVVAAILTSALAWSGAAWALTAQQQLAFDIYKELVEINTVTATGDTARAAEAMAARLRAAGFSESDLQVFTLAPRKGNLGGTVAGDGGAQANPTARAS